MEIGFVLDVINLYDIRLGEKNAPFYVDVLLVLALGGTIQELS